MLFLNLEGTDTFVVKLLLGMGKMEVGGVKPDFVSGLVLDGFLLLFVILGLHLFCGFDQDSFSLGVDSLHVVEEGFQRGGVEWGMGMGVGGDSRVSSI